MRRPGLEPGSIGWKPIMITPTLTTLFSNLYECIFFIFLYYKMNMIMLLIIALVLCAYFYPACPKLFKDNKQMLLGIVVGLLFCKYFKGDLIEGYYWKGKRRQSSGDGVTCRIPGVYQTVNRGGIAPSEDCELFFPGGRIPDIRSCEDAGLSDNPRCFNTADCE